MRDKYTTTTIFVVLKGLKTFLSILLYLIMFEATCLECPAKPFRDVTELSFILARFRCCGALYCVSSSTLALCFVVFPVLSLSVLESNFYIVSGGQL